MNKVVYILLLIMVVTLTGCTNPNNSVNEYNYYEYEYDVDTYKENATTYTGYCTLTFADSSSKSVNGQVSFYGVLESAPTFEFAGQYKFTYVDNSVTYWITFCEKTRYICGASGYASVDEIPTSMMFSKTNGKEIVIKKGI